MANNYLAWFRNSPGLVSPQHTFPPLVMRGPIVERLQLCPLHTREHDWLGESTDLCTKPFLDRIGLNRAGRDVLTLMGS